MAVDIKELRRLEKEASVTEGQWSKMTSNEAGAKIQAQTVFKAAMIEAAPDLLDAYEKTEEDRQPITLPTCSGLDAIQAASLQDHYECKLDGVRKERDEARVLVEQLTKEVNKTQGERDKLQRKLDNRWLCDMNEAVHAKARMKEERDEAHRTRDAALRQRDSAMRLWGQIDKQHQELAEITRDMANNLERLNNANAPNVWVQTSNKSIIRHARSKVGP